MGLYSKLLFAIAVTVITIVVQISDCDAATCTSSITTASGTYTNSKKLCSGKLIFKDQFNKLDLEKWQHENTLQGGGNWEFQWYTNNRSVSYVENGFLHIKPSFTADDFGNNFLYYGTLDLNGGTLFDKCTNANSWGCSRTGTASHPLNPIKSASIRTVHSFSFKYGKVEVRAKIPSGDWLSPAILLMPKNNKYGTWPASGEIDLMESRGNSELFTPSRINIGNKLVASTLHFGPGIKYNRWETAHFTKNNEKGFNEDFHKYQLEWTEDYLKFLIDDVEIGTVKPPAGGFWELGHLDHTGVQNPWRYAGKMAPFNEEYYLNIKLAVGGNKYFPDEARNGWGVKPWENSSPTAYKDFWEARSMWEKTWNMDTDDSHFQIDYVKIWAI